MFKTTKGLNPSLFESQFKQIEHKYPTRYSQNAFSIPKFNLQCNRFSINYRGPFIWNSLLPTRLKEQGSLNSFKAAFFWELLHSC